MSKLLDYRSAAGSAVSWPGKSNAIGTAPVEVMPAPTSIMSLLIEGIVIGNKTGSPITVTLVEDTGSAATEISSQMSLAAYETRSILFPHFIQASAGVNVGAKASQDDAATILMFGRVEGT